jgi:nitrogen fixation NifU-like protein
MLRLAIRRVAAPAQRALPGRAWYHETVHDHFENPRNVGSLDKNDPSVGTAIVGKASCGDVIKLQIKISDDGKITDAKFKTFGCGSAIAASSLVTEMIQGKSLDETLAIKNTDISSYLKLPPVKLHCSLLAEEAVHAAIEDYNKKNPDKAKAVEANL